MASKCFTYDEWKARREKSTHNWHRYFLDLAHHVSLKSKDPSTKTGAVIVRPDRTIVSTGYNGFNKFGPDDASLYDNREEKYSNIIHAEMNAVLHARTDLKDCTLYGTGCPCERCVVHMIQAGIRHFVWWEDTPDMLSRWGDGFKKSVMRMRDAGCSTLMVPLKFRAEIVPNEDYFQR